MKTKFMPAKEAIKITEDAERNRKQIAKEKAMQILEEFDFNEKVQEAAKDQKWKLREPIFVDDYDVAVEVCNIVNDLGYTARPQQHGYGCKCYRILIGWSQVQVRAAAGGEEIMITPKSYLKDTLKDWGATLLTFATWLVGCVVAVVLLLWFVSIVRYWFIPIAIAIGAIVGIAIECHDRYERDKALAKNQMSRAGNPMWIRGANSFTSRDEAVEYRDQVMNEMQIAWEKYVSKYGEDEDALLQRDYNARTIKKINDMIDEGEWE